MNARLWHFTRRNNCNNVSWRWCLRLTGPLTTFDLTVLVTRTVIESNAKVPALVLIYRSWVSTRVGRGCDTWRNITMVMISSDHVNQNRKRIVRFTVVHVYLPRGPRAFLRTGISTVYEKNKQNKTKRTPHGGRTSKTDDIIIKSMDTITALWRGVDATRRDDWIRKNINHLNNRSFGFPPSFFRFSMMMPYNIRHG